MQHLGLRPGEWVLSGIDYGVWIGRVKDNPDWMTHSSAYKQVYLIWLYNSDWVRLKHAFSVNVSELTYLLSPDLVSFFLSLTQSCKIHIFCPVLLGLAPRLVPLWGWGAKERLWEGKGGWRVGAWTARHEGQLYWNQTVRGGAAAARLPSPGENVPNFSGTERRVTEKKGEKEGRWREGAVLCLAGPKGHFPRVKPDPQVHE